MNKSKFLNGIKKIACSTVPVKSRIALSKVHISWLSINHKQLEVDLRFIGIKTFYLQDLVNENVAGYDSSTWPDILNDALYYAVAVQCETSGFNIDKDFSNEIAFWRNQLKHYFYTFKKSFVQKKINLVIIVQGYEPINAAARAAAIMLNIPILAIENTAIKNRMLWDDVSGITTHRNLAKNYYWKFKNTISLEVIEKYHKNLLGNIHVTKALEHQSPEGETIQLAEDKPIILYLGQILTDSSVIFGIGAWKTPINIIKASVIWCINNNYRLVLKLHPKEYNGNNPINNKQYNKPTYRKLCESRHLIKLLENNDSYIDDNNYSDTYDLIKSAKAVVTLNSQSGLEAALFGTPVIVCGESFYSGLGFTIDAFEPRLFNQKMNDAINFQVPVFAKEFSYIFFEKYCKPKTPDGLIKLISNKLGL